MAKKKTTGISALGDFNAGMILKNLPFILFLGLLAAIYIANAHYSEKKIRQIQRLQKDVKELRWNYMSLQSELMYDTKRSEVVKQAEGLKLRMPRNSPKKIIIPND